MKNLFVCLPIILLLSLASCVPQGNSATNTPPTKAKRTEARGNSTNTKNNSTGQVADKKANDENIARIVSKADRNQHSKNSNKGASNDPFERRRNALKSVSNEADRFIDTTYYMLTMENGETKVVSDVSFSEGDSKEYIGNLLNSFTVAINEAKESTLFDCSLFKVFSNQFTFNDSLRQESDFQYAECCISNNNLEEAKNLLEVLCKEKMNRGIAPRAIVRLGQVCCVMGDTKLAEKYFKRLKKEYPRSEYNKIADCSRL